MFYFERKIWAKEALLFGQRKKKRRQGHFGQRKEKKEKGKEKGKKGEKRKEMKHDEEEVDFEWRLKIFW